MSFILDALKKSESERQRKNAPGIASIPEGNRQKSSTKWIWLVLALVTINLVVLAGLTVRVEQKTTSVELPAATTGQETRPPPPTGYSEAASGAKRTETVVTKAESGAVPEATFSDPAAETEDLPAPRTGTVDNGLDTFNDLRAKGVLALPDMHLDIHVYSGQPEDRFVFVNMSKYKEHATLLEGPVVSEITPDGVILSYQGAEFLLPRE